MAVEWFATLQGKTLGPFTPDQLRGLVRDGKVTRETRVRKGMEGDWVPAGRVQRLADTALAIAAPQQAVASGARISRVIDIAGADKTLRQPGDVRFRVSIPGSFAQLAPQIGFEFCSTHGHACDIGHRQFLQSGGIQGF